MQGSISILIIEYILSYLNVFYERKYSFQLKGSETTLLLRKDFA